MTKHSHLPKTGTTAPTAKSTMPPSSAQPWLVKDFIGLLKDLSIFFGLSVLLITLFLRSMGAQSLDWILLPLGGAFFGPLITQMVLLDHKKTYIDSLKRTAKLAAENSVPKPLSWAEQKKENMMKSAEGLESARKAYKDAQEQHRDDRAGYFNRNRRHGTLLDAFKLLHFIVSDELFGGLKGATDSIYSLFKQLSERIDLACNTTSHTSTDSDKDLLQHLVECSDEQTNTHNTLRECMDILGQQERRHDSLMQLHDKSMQRHDKSMQKNRSELDRLGQPLDYCNRFHAVKPNVQHSPNITPEASSSDTESDQATPERFSSCTLVRNISKPEEKEVLIYDKDTGQWRSDRGSNAAVYYNTSTQRYPSRCRS